MTELSTIRERLADNAEVLALELFGEPTHRTGQKLSWGRKGSTVVNIAGRYRGRFKSWETDEGGSMLDAIMFAMGCNFNEAVDWAKRWLGEDDDWTPPRPPKRTRPVVDVDGEEIKRRERARALWHESQPVKGTLGERYLNGRNIFADWPHDAVRYHAKSHALVVASTAPELNETAQGVTAIQRVYLDETGGARRDETGQKIKRSLGPRYKGAVRLPGNKTALCLAEGPETGLSIWSATQNETWVALGQIAHVDIESVPLEIPIIICRDDDPRNSQSRKSLRQQIKKWRREGRTVLEVNPNIRSRSDKSDFNDLLQAEGMEAVANRINKALTRTAFIATDAAPIQWARQAAYNAIETAISNLYGGDNDSAVAIPVGTGIGKTEAYIEIIRDLLARLHNSVQPVVVAVPMHKLSDELLGRFGKDIRVASYRGREANDPGTDGEKMCLDLDTVRDVQKVGGDVQTLVCASGEKRCPFFEQCGYQKQQSQQGDVWIVSHTALFNAKPSFIPTPALRVIDENFTKQGVVGTGRNDRLIVSEYEIERQAMHGKGGAILMADLDMQLMPARRKLLTALRENGLGPLSRQKLLDAGLTYDECSEARGLEWKRKSEIGIWPGMPPAQRKAVLAEAANNSDIGRMATMWRLLMKQMDEDGPELSGTIYVDEAIDDETGATNRMLRLQYRQDLRESWAAPTLYVDATPSLNIAEMYLPSLKRHNPIQADTPHQKIVHYPDKAFGKAELMHNSKKVDEVWHWTLAKARQSGGRWLLVCQLKVKEMILEKHAVPDFIELAHHNAVAGQDRWKDVRGIVIVGRTQPPPEAVEREASALTGCDIKIDVDELGWYPNSATEISAQSGQRMTIDVDVANHPIAEEARRRTCEAEISQIIGRGRGVNRTEETPLEIHVLTNTPLTEEVSSFDEWRRPSKDDELLAKRGVWLSSAGDAAKLLGIKANTLTAARNRMMTNPYKESLYGNVTNLRMAEYQIDGAGRSKQVLLFDPREVTDFQMWISKNISAGKSTLVARQAHNLKVVGIDSAPATADLPQQQISNPLHYRSATPVSGTNKDVAWKDDITGASPVGVTTSTERTLGKGEADTSIFSAVLSADDAQSVEHLTFNQVVTGSNPVGPIDGINESEDRLQSDYESGGPGRNRTDEWISGKMPPDVADRLTETYRDCLMTQEQLAEKLGLSRPHLANAIQGRFGLTPEIVAAIKTFLHDPPIRQAALF